MLQPRDKNVKAFGKQGYLSLGLLFLSTLSHRLSKDHPLINTLQKKYSMGKMQIHTVKIFHAKRNILTCKETAKAAALNNLWFVIQVNTSFLAFCSMNSVLSPVAILSLKKPVITIHWSYFINELPHFFTLGDNSKETSIFSHLCPQMQKRGMGFFKANIIMVWTAPTFCCHSEVNNLEGNISSHNQLLLQQH